MQEHWWTRLLRRGARSRRGLRLLSAVVAIAPISVGGGGAGPAGAADATGPAIVHVPTATAPYGQEIPITLTATCATGAGCAARLFYRTTAPAASTAVPGIVGESGFHMVPMARGTATTVDGREAITWSAAIPGAAVTTRGVDYFMEAEHDAMLTHFPGSTTAAGVGSAAGYVHVLVLSPPLLHHAPVPFATAGRPIDVHADVSCSSGNCTATLHYRRTPATIDDSLGWTSTTMQPQGTGTSLGNAGVLLAYRAQVPAGSVDTTGVDYYIHVADGHTQAFSPGTTYQGWYAPRDGTRVPAVTHHVHVVEPPRIAHVPPVSVPYRSDIPVTARANCASTKQCYATLHYRTTTPGLLDPSAFVSTAMSVSRTAGVDGIDIVSIESVIPAAVGDTRGVDYFFSVTDGTATSWWPGTTPADGPGVWVDGTRVAYQHVHVQEPVHLSHVPPTAAPALEDLVIEAEVTCATEACGAHVHYTPTPAVPGSYRSIAMDRTLVVATSATRVERWRATIPGGDVTTRGVAYYLTASDGYTATAAPGTSYWGAYVAMDGFPAPEAARFVVRVVDPPHVVHAPAAVAVAGQDFRVEARSNCATSCTGTLHWRVVGLPWQSTSMVASTLVLQAYGNDVVSHTAVVTGQHVTEAGLEYRIEVDDGYVTGTTPTYAVVVTAERLTRHTAGELAFEGSAHLPVFPCDHDPLAGTPCEGGTFRGDWSAHISGSYGTSAFEVAWTTVTRDAIRADFVYSEWDCLHGVETVLGVAKGRGSAEAGPGAVQGKWHVAGEPFGRDVSRATMAFDFSWTRSFNVAQLVIEPTTLTLEVAGIGPRVVATGRQVGTAAFAVPVAGGTALPTCERPYADVEGRIAGAAEIASSGVVT
jgi:hypothetical protein